jgi:hypothetical protein
VVSVADIVAINPEPGDSTNGLYGLPVLGNPLRATRDFFDSMAPQPGDAAAKVIAKEVFRWGAVVTVSAAAATVIL